MRGYLANQSGTGTKTDTPLRETPQSITVVTADRITDQGALTVQETLRYVPGVFADAYGPDSRGDYPRIRGQDPNIYLDGTRVVNTFTSTNGGPIPTRWSASRCCAARHRCCMATPRRPACST